MKRVKLYYKGKEIGVYDNKKDAQGVVVTRMNENHDMSVFDFGIEYIEFPLTVSEAKEVLGTNENTCFLLSGDGGVTVSRTKLQALCNEADARQPSAYHLHGESEREGYAAQPPSGTSCRRCIFRDVPHPA